MKASDHPHNHQDCIKLALSQANALCAEKNIRFTPLRQRVLELLWSSHKAAKAYDILHTLQQEDKSAKPSTVYRTLDFLQELKLAHKIDSLNAYVGCLHPEEGHNCQFMICRNCETVQESCDSSVFKAITESAQKLHFIVERQMIEVHGLCANCQL